MSNSQQRRPVYNYESKGLNEALKLIVLHLIKNAITMLDDKELPPEVEKKRATIDSEIKEQQMIVDDLLNKSQVTVGVAHATAYPSCLSKARMQQDNI
ncbi:hypothetical protein LHV16_02305 [Providencia rettgeri]|uniref:hypothetical protein n=1 Tax=Providencia rettgeri TaxID=587 RepID=UPI001B3792BD|nr:hypothetical protein [Providencia rettgeri]EJD6367353.1 hypothetical protein [Providencia rettgeri]EJD6372316.1 hypothetical protein [Providencia rettgeri]ELR5161030.1 hypothetical protein [Providencia rettgeri]ELR5250151.1 hypothetical protein [Providencia rettgeri]MBQ0360989.1 hypothetical protein [Providencia rettgeri]